MGLCASTATSPEAMPRNPPGKPTHNKAAVAPEPQVPVNAKLQNEMTKNPGERKTPSLGSLSPSENSPSPMSEPQGEVKQNERTEAAAAAAAAAEPVLEVDTAGAETDDAFFEAMRSELPLGATATLDSGTHGIIRYVGPAPGSLSDVSHSRQGYVLLQLANKDIARHSLPRRLVGQSTEWDVSAASWQGQFFMMVFPAMP